MGCPVSTSTGWARRSPDVLDWEPEHLSAYGLTLDAGSLWGAAGVEGLPAEDTVVAQYWALARASRGAGFEHYEISNYARPGSLAPQPDLLARREYLAIGPGRCGFVGDVRYGNVKPVARYAPRSTRAGCRSTPPSG